MKYIEHEFNGITRRLSFTAGALFRLYEKFDYTSNIVETLKLTETSIEAWNNTCWLYALCAEQGRLQLKAMGLEIQPVITYEQLRTQASPAEVSSIKTAVLEALNLGFKRDAPVSDDEEVDLVLQELEENEKKKGGWERIRTAFFSACGHYFHYGPGEALILTPGRFADMCAWVAPPKEDD